MIRLPAVLLILLVLPGTSFAQQVSTGPDRSHYVVSGETLGSIAQQYFGSASEWRRIFEANRDQLDDPDLLSVGMTLVIPGPAGADVPTATVSGVEVLRATPQAQDLGAYESRRGLLESRPFTPLGSRDVSPGDRTVFFDVPDPEESRTVITLEPPEVVTAVPEDAFYAASWIQAAGGPDEQIGTVVRVVDGEGVELGEVSAHLLKDVRIQITAEGSPSPGDELLVYDASRVIEDVGEVMVPTGRVRVREVEGPEVLAEVVQAFARVRLGQRVARLSGFPLEPGVHPTDGDVLEGRVLGLEQEQELYSPGDRAFVDLGADDGLAIGDELIGVPDDAEDWTGRVFVNFQVVGVRGSTGTVRVIATDAPRDIREGLRVVTTLRMP